MKDDRKDAIRKVMRAKGLPYNKAAKLVDAALREIEKRLENSEVTTGPRIQ